MMLVMMKLPILTCAEKQKPILVYRMKNHELKPITAGSITDEVSPECLW